MLLPRDSIIDCRARSGSQICVERLSPYLPLAHNLLILCRITGRTKAAPSLHKMCKLSPKSTRYPQFSRRLSTIAGNGWLATRLLVAQLVAEGDVLLARSDGHLRLIGNHLLLQVGVA